MKYIDADKLKSLLDAKYKDFMGKAKNEGYPTLQYQYMADGIDIAEQLIDSLQQEQPSEICSKCIHHGKDDDYCYNPHGGMQSLINENGVYECTGFCEQEQPEVDLDFSMFAKEMDVVFNLPEEATKNTEQNPLNWGYAIARHFYELGLNARKEDKK